MCSYQTERKSHLETHLKNHSKTTAPVLECRDCGFKCIRSGDLSRHRVKQHSSRAMTCDLSPSCKYRTDCKRSLDKHRKYSHRNKNQDETSENPRASYSCDQCEYKSPSLSFYNRHLSVHSGKSKRKLVKGPLRLCDQCPYSTRKKVNLDRHVTSVHRNERNFRCQFCQAGFKRPDALKCHLVTHESLMKKAEMERPINLHSISVG